MTGVADSFVRSSGAAHVTARGGVAIVSAQAKVTMGSPGPVAIGNVSGEVRVTAASPGLRVNFGEIQASAATVSVRAGVLGNVAITQVSGALTNGGISVSANGGSLAVSANGGQMPVGLRGDAVFNAAVSNPVKFAVIETQASVGTHNLVSLVAARRLRVLGYTLVTQTTTQVCFRDGTAAATKLTGSMPLASHGGASPALGPWGQFQTSVSHALSLTVDAATTVAGHLTYQEVV